MVLDSISQALLYTFGGYKSRSDLHQDENQAAVSLVMHAKHDEIPCINLSSQPMTN